MSTIWKLAKLAKYFPMDKASARVRDEGRVTTMCASKNPFMQNDRRCFAQLDFMIFHELFHEHGICIHDKWRDDIVAILDARPPQRGGKF